MLTRDLAHERLPTAQIALHRVRFLEIHDRLQHALRVVQPGRWVRPVDRSARGRETIDVGLESRLRGYVGVLPLAGPERGELRRRSIIRPPSRDRLAGHRGDEARDLLD